MLKFWLVLSAVLAQFSHSFNTAKIVGSLAESITRHKSAAYLLDGEMASSLEESGWLYYDLYLGGCSSSSDLIGSIGATTQDCHWIDNINGTYTYVRFLCSSTGQPKVLKFSNAGQGCIGSPTTIILNETCYESGLVREPFLYAFPHCQVTSGELPVNYTSVTYTTYNDTVCSEESNRATAFAALEATTCISRLNDVQTGLCNGKTINGVSIEQYPVLLEVCDALENFASGGSLFESYLPLCFEGNPYLALYSNKNCNPSSAVVNGTSLSTSCCVHRNDSFSSSFGCIGDSAVSSTYILDFVGVQTIDGCSEEQYYSNPSYATVLRGTVADGMPGVSSNMVTIVDVDTPSASTAADLDEQSVPHGSRALTSPALSFVVTYNVSVYYPAFGSNKNTAFNSLAAELTTFVVSGHFTAYLQSTATSGSNNATAFLHASSSTVKLTCLNCPASPTMAPVAPTTDSAGGISPGGIVGIVFALLVAASAAAYCAWQRECGQKAPMATTLEPSQHLQEAFVVVVPAPSVNNGL